MSILVAAGLILSTPHLESEPPLVELAWQEAAQRAMDPRHKADLDGDVKVGKKYADQVEKELKISKNEELQARVQRIGQDLGAIARAEKVVVTWGDKRLNPFDYQFKVVEDTDVNAFSLPGGFIYVYEGLIQFAESDDELAGVLAHEISHASFRHVATLQREASRLQLVTLPLILISIFAGGGGDTAPAVGTLASLYGTAKGSGWSVSAEEAADYGGLQYMRKSKYNPVGMLTFMERLAKGQKATDSFDPGIYRTHPPSRTRAETLAKRLTEANIPIRRSLVSPSYRVVLKDRESGVVEAWFDNRRVAVFGGPDARGRALETAVRLNEFFDEVPALFDLQMRDKDVIVGRRKMLMRVTAEDAAAAKTSVEELAARSREAIKASLYLLAWRIWDFR